MARHLYTVSDTFFLQGRGVVLIPGIKPVDDELFRIGDPIVLRKPDGTTMNTEIGGIEMLDPNPNYEVVIMLKGLTKDDVPVGTEVWSANS
ncbi:MAG: hypothetical protein ACKVT0_19510 [Planctomycetaceae bacterium]